MLRDSIERQGTVAETNRQKYLDAMRAQAPTDLAPERRAKLEQALNLNSLRDAAARGGGAPDAPSGGVVVVDPAGGRHTFRDPAAAEAFKKAAGIR